MPRLRRLAAACCLAAPLALAACSAAAGPGPGSAAAGSPLRSAFERRTGDTVSRDCGYSAPLPARPSWSLWLFCDTQVLTGPPGRSQHVASLILGADTAAVGLSRPGGTPGLLAELPSPSPAGSSSEAPARPGPPARLSASAPAPFLPVPGGLISPGTAAPCGGGASYPAAWISGVTRAPAAAGRGRLLITYDDYCAAGFPGTSATAEGFGLAEYDPARGTVTTPPPVFRASPLPYQQTLGSPVIGRDGYLYLFGYGPGGVSLARVPDAPSFWQNPFAYSYRSGSGWSASATAAASLLPPGPAPLGAAAAAVPGRGIVLVEQTSLSGDFTVWRAPAPAGPWRRALSARVPCSRGTGR
ncbi:MAG: hypothetical protein FWE15_21980, partial [Actinomycetia bacterium]|nr:hypothetical protein [Actinomycetes bacterium]